MSIDINAIDGIIFDIDGTIWDSTGVVEKAWNRSLEECGYDKRVTADELKGLFGLPMEDIFNRIVTESDEDRKQNFMEMCSQYEFEYLRREAGIVYEGFGELLRSLKGRYKLAIVSNCQQGYIEIVCEATGFTPYFDVALCPGDTGVLKAANIKIAAERAGMQCPLYVGDTHMDEVATREAGAYFCHAAYGFGYSTEPDFVINSPMELAEILGIDRSSC